MHTRWLWQICWIGLLSLLISCQDEILPPKTNSTASECILSETGKRLQQALDEDYYPTTLRTIGLDSINRRLAFDELKPMWERSKTFKTHNQYIILRVPIIATAYWGRVTDEMTEDLGSRYLEPNMTYLVRVEDQEYPEGRNYFMHLVPSLSFLESNLSLDSDETLIPSGFDGEIELYRLDGRILSRELYKQGKRYKRYKYPNDEAEASLRSSSTDDGNYDCIKVRYKREYNYIDDKNNEVVAVVERKEYERCYPRLGGSNNVQRTNIIDGGGGGGSGGTLGSDSTRRLFTGEIRHIAELMSTPDSIIADSTVTKMSKEALKRIIDSVYTEMTGDCFFAALVGKLKGMEGKRPVISKIKLLGLGIPGTATYSTNNELAFQEVENITVPSMSHEMIHAYQFRHHRIDTMKSNTRRKLFGMIEFERALMQNLLDYIACGGNHLKPRPDGELVTWFAQDPNEVTDEKKGYRTAYVDWLHTLTNEGEQLPDTIDEKQFYHFSEEFGKHYRGYNINKGYIYGDSVGYKPTAINAMIKARKQFNDCK